MALATQCPHCQTTFRVAQDQLKLRSGLVRCGSCKQIFNGIENLRPEESAQTAPPTPAPTPDIPSPAPVQSATEPPPSATASATEIETHAEASAIDVAPEASPVTVATGTVAPAEPEASISEQEHLADDAGVNDDPLLRMTLMDFAHLPRPASEDETSDIPHSDTEAPDPLDQAIDDLQRRPWRAELQESADETDELDRAESADYEEPSFVKQGRRRQRMGRILRVVMGTGTIILLITLLAQGAYVFRDQIAAKFPQTKTVLAAACDQLGCQVGLPSEIDAVSIESNELQALEAGGDTFALSVLLRNHGSTDQTWPHIELTLNDNNEKPIVRRAFSPREYLGTEYDPRQGFRARSEQPVKLYFQLAQLKASGYRVYVFYP